MLNTPISKLAKPQLTDVLNIETSIHPYSNAADTMMVPRYATTTDRNNAIPAPSMGQMCYVTATNELYIYRSQVAAWCSAVPRYVKKAAVAQFVNNSTTLVNDDALFFATEANSFYAIDNYFCFASNTTADFKTAWSLPAGATSFSNFIGQDGAGGCAVLGQWINTATVIHAYNSLGITTHVIEKIYLSTVSAGTMQFRWAQNTAQPINSYIELSSFLLINKVG